MDEKEAEARPVMGTIFLVDLGVRTKMQMVYLGRHGIQSTRTSLISKKGEMSGCDPDSIQKRITT